MTVVLFGKPIKNYIGKGFSVLTQIGSLYGESCFFNHIGEVIDTFSFSQSLGMCQKGQIRNVLSLRKGEVSFANSFGFNERFVFKQQKGKLFKFENALSANGNRTFVDVLGISKELLNTSALGVNRGKTKVSILGMSLEPQFTNEIKEGLWYLFSFENSIVDGIGNKTFVFGSSLGFGNTIGISNELKEGFFKRSSFENSIDYYISKTFSIRNDVSDGMFTAFDFKLAIDTTPAFTQIAKVFIVNQDISGKVVECTVNLFGSEVLSDCDISIKDKDFLSLGELKVEIESVSFEFLSEEITQDKKNNSTRVWGRSKSAKFYEPFSVKKKVSCKLGRASEIVSELLSGFELVWEIDDFWIKNLSEEGYPLEIAKRIVEAGGGVLRAAPDGRIYAVYAYRKEQPQYSLDLIISATLERKQKEADGVTVVFGDSISHPISIEANETEVPVGTWVDVKVYSLVPYNFSSTADAFYRVEEGAIEIVEEEITMENGQGTISKPVLEVVEAPSWVKIEGQAVTCDGCKLATIRYKTKCDVWKVTNYTEGKTLNCSVVTENSVTVLNGSGERIITIEEPLICEPGIARRRAEQELIKRSGYWKASITVPFDSELVDYRGALVETPWGKGIVTSQSISVESDPLKVLQELEVMLWPQ